MKHRGTLVAAALALVGAAWLLLTWSTRAPVAAAPQPDTTADDVTITWEATQPTNLSRSQDRGVGDGVRFPRILIGPDRAYAAWEAVYDDDAVPDEAETFLTLSDNQASWSEPQVVSESLQTASEHTSFSQGTDGDLHLIWHETLASGNYQLMYQRRSSTGAIESTQELGLYSFSPPAPAAVVNGSQNVHITWQGYNPGTSFDIFYRRSKDGGASWLAATQAVSLPSSSLDPALAVDGSNQAHVAWMENLGAVTKGVIMYRVGTPVDDGMTWGTVITPSAHLTDCVKPSIVVSGTKAYIGWGKVLKGQKLDIYFARCSALACTTPIMLGPSVVVNTSDPSQSAPVLAIDEHGTLAAVWHGDQEHSEPGPFTLEEILFTYSTDGGTTWAEVQNVSRTPDQRSIDPHLALVDGVAHVVWKERYDAATPQKYDVWYANSAIPPVYLPLVLRNK
jgi:hypothetical protein